jgi:hypothetical protein
MAPRGPRRTRVRFLSRELNAQERQADEQQDERDRCGHEQPGMACPAEGVPAHPAPENDETGDRCEADHEHRCEQRSAPEREVGEPHRGDHKGRDEGRCCGEANAHKANLPRRYARLVTEANYVSGDDYVVEFLGYRFAFNCSDFEQRVTAAAVKLGLVGDNELDDDETADLVELVERDWIDEPRSGLGRYLVRHWERVSLVGGESLVYWLKKLVFRGAWLDHRVKEGLLEVAWDEDVADFGYRDPNGDRALLELAPVPSWHELQFRR